MHKSYAITFISEIRTDVANYIENQLKIHGIEGLVASHGSILTALYKNNGRLPMKEVAERINRSKSTTTQLVDKLILSGFVKKEISEEDARVHYINLTEKGWSVRNTFVEISQLVNEVFFTNFTESEQEIFLKLLLKVKNNFEK